MAIKELQLRVNPQTAYTDSLLQQHIALQENITVNDITFVKIVKRSIDARQRQVMVNLKVRVYIGERPESTSLITPIDYKPVDGTRQAIVVGAGPGGLFAALRLIEVGIKPIVLERGKDVNERRKDLARI
ncbi:MAG: FAD-dependent monooxygenase, partial [Muribaculaceae bacterium]